MRCPVYSRLQRLFLAGVLGLLAATAAQAAKPDPHGAPDKFVLDAANEALNALKADGQLRSGDLARVNQAVDTYILPYVNFRKTPHIAAGRYQRQAPPEQPTAPPEPSQDRRGGKR